MSIKDYLGEYSPLQRDPVALPQWIKDTAIFIVAGLVMWTNWEPTVEQMAWLLQAAAVLSAGVALWSRRHAFPAEKVYNEFIDAERGMDTPPDSVEVREIGEYGEVPVVREDKP